MISALTSVRNAQAFGTKLAAREGEIAGPQDTAQLSREIASLDSKLPGHVEGEVLVKLHRGFQADEAFVGDYGATLVEEFDIPPDMRQKIGGKMVHLRLPEGVTTAEAMVAMGRDGRVAYACANELLSHYGDPVFPPDLDTRLWGLHNTGQDEGTADADIDAPEAWAITTGKGLQENGPVIAVIDTGIDTGHPDLRANLWTNTGEIPGDGIDNDGNGVIDDVHGYNAIDGSGNPYDDNRHGTHCAGTIAADGTNGEGVVGVNHKAQLMAVKFLSGQGSGTTADAVKGLLYADRMGARITSNSWGGGGFNEALRDTLEASHALHIFAAGNSNNDNDARASYPASYDLDNIVSVAASDRNDQRASFSNYGATSVDLAAPGKTIFSTVPGGRYATLSGTSMATPHVAGVAGLIASAYPEASNDDIKGRLLNGVDRLPQLTNKVLSGGRLNAANSLEDDHIAPGAPNDFRTEAAGARTVRLSWTATGDDGWCGRASAYQLRHADRPIVEGPAGESEVGFDQATTLVAPKPSETGTIEQVMLNLPPSGQPRTLHFALKVADNLGNLSEIRTATAQIPASTVAFQDNFDNNQRGWTAEADWARIDEPGRGKIWTDSPNGNYANERNASLVSPPINLAAIRNSALLFDTRYEIEQSFDRLHLEVSTDNKIWNKLEDFTGRSEWKQHLVDLSRYDGQTVRLRFRLESDSSVVRDGFYLDNISVVGDPNI